MDIEEFFSELRSGKITVAEFIKKSDDEGYDTPVINFCISNISNTELTAENFNRMFYKYRMEDEGFNVLKDVCQYHGEKNTTIR